MSEETPSSAFRESYSPFKKYWHFLLANIGLAILITLSAWSRMGSDVETFLMATFWSFCVTITLWTGNALLSIYISRKVSWSERPILRTFLGVLSTSLYSTFAFFSVQIALQYLFFQQFPEDLFQWMGDHYQVPLIISLAISTVFVAVGFFKRWRESEEKADRFQAQMMTYKYEALRNQINPHFLFNSFNVLTDLVYENQDLASQFIQQLSELYRYVLDSRDKELVPIQEEIDFLNSYLFLLQIRFEQKLQVELKLEPEPDQLLVPMSLQLLIENAVKHNEVSSLNPLKVVVEQQGDSVIVRNSLNLKSVGEDSKKTGLKNIMDQYALWTDREIKVTQTESEFEVKIPLLRRAKS